MHTWLTMDMWLKVILNRIERLYYEQMGLRAVMIRPEQLVQGRRDQIHEELIA